MRNLIRRWLGGSPARDAADAIDEIRRWAEQHGHRFARARGGEGFVVEAAGGGAIWRIEWGPSQRRYIEGQELRVRAELGDTGELQLFVATQDLMAHLESEVFEQAIEDNRTRVDDDTPEEMRWLVLYRKLGRNELGDLREHFGAVSNPSRAAAAWLEGPLMQHLAGSRSWLGQDAMAIIVQRGRFVLRVAQPHITPAKLAAALGLAIVAAQAARRVAAEVARGAFSSQQPEP